MCCFWGKGGAQERVGGGEGCTSVSTRVSRGTGHPRRGEHLCLRAGDSAAVKIPQTDVVKGLLTDQGEGDRLRVPHPKQLSGLLHSGFPGETGAR